MHSAGQGGGLLSASLLGSRFPLLQNGGTGARTPAKRALLKPCSPAAPWLTEQTHGRGKSSCHCLRAAQHQAMHRSRGEGGEHPACPRPSALKCIFSLMCNTVLLSQTMSVFDQFLYPRHCRAERPWRPDGLCCRSLPALPRPPPNSLQIPGMPAPPKTSPRQRQRQASASRAGAGGPPQPPLLVASSSHRAGPRQQAVAPGCRLLHRATGKQFCTRNRRSVGPLLLLPVAGKFPPLRGGMHRPQNPPSQPQRHGRHWDCRRWEGRLPIIPTTCPKPPGPCHIAHSSSFHPRLPALIPALAAGCGGSLSPSQNPGANPSLGRIKGKAPADFKQPASPLSQLPQDRQLGWQFQATLKHIPEVRQGSCSSCNPPSTLASAFLGGGGSPPAPGRSLAEHNPVAGGENKGCQKRSFSLEEGQETSVHTLKLGKSPM